MRLPDSASGKWGAAQEARLFKNKKEAYSWTKSDVLFNGIDNYLDQENGSTAAVLGA